MQSPHDYPTVPISLAVSGISIISRRSTAKYSEYRRKLGTRKAKKKHLKAKKKHLKAKKRHLKARKRHPNAKKRYNSQLQG